MRDRVREGDRRERVHERRASQLVECSGATDRIPAAPARYISDTIATTASRPTVNASSQRGRLPEPERGETSVISGARSDHTGPLEKPSNVVVPIIVHSSATVPGPASRVVTPDSSART